MTEKTNETNSGTTPGKSDETPTKSKRSKNRNYETKVGQAEELLQVLQVENAENLTGFGIAPEAVKEFAGMIEKLKVTAVQQDEAKAKLKTLSARLRTELKQMEKRFAIFKRKIKAEVPQEEWKRFGFDDKQ